MCVKFAPPLLEGHMYMVPMIETRWWLNHPFDNYAPQIGSFPEIRVKTKTIWNHHLLGYSPNESPIYK